MSKEIKKVDFDLSTLTLTELLSLHDEIKEFLSDLEDIKIEEDGGDD